MLSNILVGTLCLGIGFIIGMYTTSWMMLSITSKHPIEAVRTLLYYASKW